jgi:CRP/FNR family transcriptional regulator, cyclic AMP receptor protein
MENLIVATKKIKNGETILQEGSWAFYAYLIKSGKAKVFKRVHDKQVQIGSLKQGDLFGEMAFLGGAQRSATVVADGDVEVGEIPLHSFNEAVAQLPRETRAMMEAMVSDLTCISEASSHLMTRLQDIQNIKTRVSELKSLENEIKKMPEIMRQVVTSLAQRLTTAVEASAKLTKVLEDVVHSVDSPSATLIKKSQ